MVGQAVFLVGGRGTRLGSLATYCPKPLLSVGGRPFLDYLVSQAARAGIREILLLAGHCADRVAEYAEILQQSMPEMQVLVSTEPEAAGTAGGLLYAQDKLQEAFFLFNGDSLFDCPLSNLTEASAADPCLARIALRWSSDVSRYGTVKLEEGRVTEFIEKGAVGSGLLNAGVYLLRRQIVNYIDRLPSSLENEIFPRLASAGELAGTVSEGYFIDIGIPDDFERAQTEVPASQLRAAK